MEHVKYSVLRVPIDTGGVCYQEPAFLWWIADKCLRQLWGRSGAGEMQPCSIAADDGSG
jgi:hypothetical protein